MRPPAPAGHALPASAAFRSAMAQLVHAVHIVTTAGEAGRAGMTATAVASVSDNPPTVLACIVASSRTLAAIEANGVFCINALAADDRELAEIFAGRRGIVGEGRFAHGQWSASATGAPVLGTALASFDCRLVAIHPVATHHVLIGEVAALTDAGGDERALIHHRRVFGVV